MTREERNPDTKTFHFYNANPHNRYGTDCVIRALCTAMNQSWEQTVRELTEVGIKMGCVLNDTSCYSKYLKEKGWVKMPQPRKQDNTKYTAEEFCKKLADKNTNYIAHVGGGHVAAIIQGKVYDIWNSTQGCIGNYWVNYKLKE